MSLMSEMGWKFKRHLIMRGGEGAGGAGGASVQLSEISVQWAPEAPIVIVIVIAILIEQSKTWMEAPGAPRGKREEGRGN